MKKCFMRSAMLIALSIVIIPASGMYSTTLGFVRSSNRASKVINFGAKSVKTSGNKTYGEILTGVQILTGGTLVAAGVKLACDASIIATQPVEGEPMPPMVQEWIRNNVRTINSDADIDQIPLLSRKNVDLWEVHNGKVIIGSQCEVDLLEECIITKLKSETIYNDAQVIFNQLNTDKTLQYYDAVDKLSTIINETKKNEKWIDRHLARTLFIIKHECGHYVSEDFKYQRYYALLSVPIVVEAVCSLVRYSGGRLFNIGHPKNIGSLVFRSLLSVGGIPLKYLIENNMYLFYERFREKKADQFACEHSEARIELEGGYKFFKDIESSFYLASEKNDASFRFLDEEEQKEVVRHYYKSITTGTHPYPGDRAEMVQEYLDKWDQEH